MIKGVFKGGEIRVLRCKREGKELKGYVVKAEQGPFPAFDIARSVQFI